MNELREAIARYQMLSFGDGVVVGVSGGADSMALLDMLCTGLPELQLQVAVCHINHQLRGAESDADEQFVRAACARYHVQCFCFTEDAAALAARNGQSVELAARELRYRQFEALADRLGAKIATAHTLSDSMETMLFHLARGTGLRGLAGIPPVRARIIRPLIGMTRMQVEAYLAARSLPYRIDSSNLTDGYTRNRIRHHLVPELYQLNPSADMAVGRLQALLRETEEYLQEQARQQLGRLQEGDKVSLLELRALPIALRRAILVQLLREWGIEPEFARVQRMLDGIREGNCCIELRQGLFFECKGEWLHMFPKRKVSSLCDKSGQPIPLPFPLAGNIIQIRGKTLCFLYEEYEHFKNIANIEKSLLKNLVDYDKIGDNAVVRTRYAGDRFTHPKRKWTKTLKKLFNEYHIPPGKREDILVCADNQGVFWVEGFGADARVSPGCDTRRVLEIKRAEESGTCERTS